MHGTHLLGIEPIRSASRLQSAILDPESPKSNPFRAGELAISSDFSRFARHSDCRDWRKMAAETSDV
jgi:hypothetical protein